MKKFLTQPLTIRFGVLACGIILLTAFSAQVFYARQGRTDLEQRLREKSTFINSFYSYLIADALMRKDDVTLLQIVNRLEQDEEITSVIVVDESNQIRYHMDPHKMGSALDDPIVKQVLKSGEAIMVTYRNTGGAALGIVSPLKIQGTLRSIGVVRIDLTYRRIENQLERPLRRYWFMIFGLVISLCGAVLTCLGKWVTIPLNQLSVSLSKINPSVPESNLPEYPNELGAVFKAVNELVFRFKTESQQQWASQNTRAEQEKAWIQRLTISFLPGARILIADKDNRVISDTGETPAPGSRKRAHLLDLIKDANFATLLTDAFQKEGEVVRGSVTFQKKSYEASILSVPIQQAVIVKTLIALQPR